MKTTFGNLENGLFYRLLDGITEFEGGTWFMKSGYVVICGDDPCPIVYSHEPDEGRKQRIYAPGDPIIYHSAVIPHGKEFIPIAIPAARSVSVERVYL